MSLPSKKTIFLILLFLLPVIASAAYATYRHSAFVVGDGKDIDLNGQSIGNGTFVGSILVYQAEEEYANHLGTLDNFTAVEILSGAEVSGNAERHIINLTSGVAADGDAFYHAKRNYSLSTKPIIVNTLFQNFNNGSDGERWTFIGLKGYSGYALDDCVCFVIKTDNTWFAATGRQIGGETYNLISIPPNGSLLTISATSTAATFMVNGSVVSTISTNLTTAALYPSVEVVNMYLSGATTSNRSLSVDFFSLKKYY